MPIINKVLYSRVGPPTNIRLDQGQTLAYYEHSEIMAVNYYYLVRLSLPTYRVESHKAVAYPSGAP
jgi:hypothetical protein